MSSLTAAGGCIALGGIKIGLGALDGLAECRFSPFKGPRKGDPLGVYAGVPAAVAVPDPK